MAPVALEQQVVGGGLVDESVAEVEVELDAVDGLDVKLPPSLREQGPAAASDG